MNEPLPPSKEQYTEYVEPLRRYYDSCTHRERYDDLLLAAVELYDSQIGDGAFEAAIKSQTSIIPSEEFFDRHPQQAKERFSLLPLESIADVVEGQYDQDLERAWLSTALRRIRGLSLGHNLDHCLDDEAYVHSHGCEQSELCPIKFVRNFLVADSYIGERGELVGLQVDQLYVEGVANYKRDLALQHDLISKATHERLEIDYYSAHYPAVPQRRTA